MLVLFFVLVAASMMMVIEHCYPGRTWKPAPQWLRRALTLNICQALSVFLGGVAWDHWFIHNTHLFQHLDIVSATILGYVTITFVYYWWHRARHQLPFLWRWFHQIHHSPQRIQILTSFYKHPSEIIANGVLSSFILYGVLGLTPEIAILVTIITGLAELFYHWNIKTPYLLGYIIQRPESHCVHHLRDYHHKNYSDLPLWDILFGTFHNPKTSQYICGFDSDKEIKLLTMLKGYDVNRRFGFNR